MKVIKRLENELRTKRDNIAHMQEKIQFYQDYIPKVQLEVDELEGVIKLLKKHYEQK
ncbi:hypothetical protein [Bacillus weihaiensis]|uniref:hypothetical protein n=1 Tax=Bacillus weihaiensis TaxID=1547283 RepID=UPI002356FA36|nr:hypothetical protein [Bacillus weihaiensis]